MGLRPSTGEEYRNIKYLIEALRLAYEMPMQFSIPGSADEGAHPEI